MLSRHIFFMTGRYQNILILKFVLQHDKVISKYKTYIGMYYVLS